MIIIHHNQTGSIKDRYIGETVRSIFDIIDLTAKLDIPGLLIFIAIRKAFDRIQSCVINKDITSNYFTIKRGVRQGDPLSPYLFAVAVEILAIAIRQNSAIKGITIGEKETKLLQYADDTTAVLSDINSAQTLFKLLDDFKRLSGLEVNLTKTGMWNWNVDWIFKRK